MKRKKIVEKVFNTMLGAGFVAFVIYCLLQNGFDVFTSEAAELPNLSQAQNYKEADARMKGYVFELEEDYNTNLFQRMEKVREYGRLSAKTGKKVLDDVQAQRSVIRGDKGLLYYAISTPVDTTPYLLSFQRLHDFLDKKGIYFAYVQAPYKHMKNSSTFPKGVVDYGNEIATEFAQGLKREGIPVLDLNEVFASEGRREEDLFFKTDTHWKIPTAFYGYQKTVAFLQKEGVVLEDAKRTADRANYKLKRWEKVYIGSHGKRAGEGYYEGKDDLEVLLPTFKTDLQYRKYNREGKLIKERKGSFEDSFMFYGYLNSKDKYQDKYVVYMDWGASEDLIYNRRAKKGKKLLLIKDSFAMPLAGFLSLNFEETVLLDIRDENRPQSIEAYVEEHDFDAVLFVASPTSMSYHPEMFLMPLH